MTQQGFTPGLSSMQCSGRASCAAGGHGGVSAARGSASDDALAERLAGSLERSALSDEAAIRRRRVSAILRAVEREVVPRLLSAHAARPASLATHAVALAAEGPARGTGGADNGGLPPGDTGTAPRVTPEAVLALVGALLGPDPATAAAACVAACRAQGVAVETICLELLSGAARHLGDLWVEDRCSFTEVTLAAVQLHRLLHALAPGGRDGAGEAAPDGAAERAEGGVAGLALLVAAPGEQHSLGLSMLSDFFRGAGWQVQNPAIAGAADAARVVA
ncbi:MAG: cobalamin B12-binding domain-containing protein, partial [Janthinobacterium lividum]